MSLIVETGQAGADSESYASVADADAYQAKRGNDLWGTITTAEKEEALRRATDYMGQEYRRRWAGIRKTNIQALDWPRYQVPIDDSGAYAYYSSDTVPILVVNACIEIAFKAAQGDLSPDIAQRVIREKVDVLEVQYSDHGPQYTTYRAIDNMLSAFMGGGSFGAFHKVVRT